MIHRWFLLLVPLGVAGCDPGKLDDPDRFKACMLNVETDIFLPKCGMAGCHSAASPQNGLDLVSSGVRMRLASGTSMCQGKSLVSFMAEKLTAAPSCGSSMPLGEPLPSNELKCVRDYLAALVADGGT